MLIITAFLTTLYDVLEVLQAELEHSHRSDNTVPFLFMIMAHAFSIILVKQLIMSIGRTKNTEAGKSIFYTLFGANPAIRYLMWIFILIFSFEYTTIFTTMRQLSCIIGKVKNYLILLEPEICMCLCIAIFG